MYIVVGRLLLIVPNHHPADDNDEDDHDEDDGVDVKDDDEERNPNSEMLRRPSWSTSPACSNSSNSSLQEIISKLYWMILNKTLTNVCLTSLLAL